MIIALVLLAVGFFAGLRATAFSAISAAVICSVVLLAIWSMNDQLSMFKLAIWVGDMSALAAGYFSGAIIRERRLM